MQNVTSPLESHQSLLLFSTHTVAVFISWETQAHYCSKKCLRHYSRWSLSCHNARRTNRQTDRQSENWQKSEKKYIKIYSWCVITCNACVRRFLRRDRHALCSDRLLLSVRLWPTTRLTSKYFVGFPHKSSRQFFIQICPARTIFVTTDRQTVRPDDSKL
jgi:hypothetical protein